MMPTAFTGLRMEPKRNLVCPPAPVAAALKSDFPEVEEVTRLIKFPNMDKVLMRYDHNNNTKQFFETYGYYVDSTFFKIFTYEFSSGNVRSALDDPNSIVISELIADKSSAMKYLLENR
jgi:putative ABC transport system permease protein